MPKMQNRVQETTTTGGTGTITLAGAVTGYITFAAGFTTGDVLLLLQVHYLVLRSSPRLIAVR
jgi:hypothetical protein